VLGLGGAEGPDSHVISGEDGDREATNGHRGKGSCMVVQIEAVARVDCGGVHSRSLIQADRGRCCQMEASLGHGGNGQHSKRPQRRREPRGALVSSHFD